MRFGVLGPLRVCTDSGSDVVLRSRHERVLLGMLLVRPGQVATTDHLVEALWPEHRPASFASNLQTYVSRVRERLPGVPIEHLGGGYRIRPGDDRVDVLVFRRDVAAGRAALAAGDAGTAVSLLRNGLRQWRGRPFADISVAALEPYVAQWQMERLGAIEDCVDAELAVGDRLPDVLAELHRLVTEHPLRERLHGQLMTALSLAGRRADALAAYQEARTILVSRLGIEPGPRLRRLHQSVLRGEEPVTRRDDLAVRRRDPAPATAPGWSAVCQLPPALSGFVGRDALVDRAEALLEPAASVRMVTLSGQPGVGKSALAVVIAHRVRAAFPDGQLYVHLGGGSTGPRRAEAALADLLRSLGTAESAIPRGLPALSAAFRAKVADRRILIVLDDAEDPAQIRPLVPGTPGSAVLITSRRRLSGLIDACHVPVEPLAGADAVALLTHAVGARRVAEDRAAAARIAAACGRLPLALRIAGTRLATRSWRLRTLADRLDDERRRLTELSIGDQQVRAALALSVRTLSPPAREAFGLLGLPGPAGFAGWAVAALLGRPEVEPVIDELVEANLVEPIESANPVDPVAGEPRYRLHDLLRCYADELTAEHPDVRGAARIRLLTATAEHTRAVAGRLPRTLTWFRPGGSATATATASASATASATDTGSATNSATNSATDAGSATGCATTPDGAGDPLAWFDAELEFLTGAVTMAQSAGADGYAVDIAEHLAPFLWSRGRWGELRALQRTVRRSAERAGDERAVARSDFVCGVLSLVCGDLADADANFTRAGAAFDRVGDRHGLACVLSDQAVLFAYHNRFELSAAVAREAVTLFRAESDPVAAVLASPALSAALRGMGRLDEALEVDTAAVVQARRQDAAVIVLARTLNSLTVTRLLRGEHRLAYAAAAESARRLRAVGDRYVLLAALRHVASAAAGLGRRDEAVRLLRESHDLAVLLGDRVWATGLERDLAVSWIGEGRAADAVPVLRRCLETYSEMDIRSALATTLDMLARAYDALGDREAAGAARSDADTYADPPRAAVPVGSRAILRLAEDVGGRR